MRCVHARIRQAAAAAVVVAVLSACTGDAPGPSTSTNGSSMTLDPDRPPETMTGLPTQETAARAEIRRRMVAEWAPLLQASGLTSRGAAFGVYPAPYDHDAVTGVMTVSFGKVDESAWAGVEATMSAAAQATGWGQAGVSHGMNLRKGPFFLNGGCGGIGGCYYTIETSHIKQNIADINFVNLPVSELDRFRDPSAPPETPTGTQTR